MMAEQANIVPAFSAQLTGNFNLGTHTPSGLSTSYLAKEEVNGPYKSSELYSLEKQRLADR